MENFNCNSVSTSSSRVGSPAGTETGADDVDETQDEESSSLQSVPQVESELENFRKQWKREIELSPNKEKLTSPKTSFNSDDNIEEQAKYIFLRGIQAEKLGKLQDAIALYRRAIQLVPDIEFKIAETMYEDSDEMNDESEDERDDDGNIFDSDDEMDDLITKFQKCATKEGTSIICQRKLEQKMKHISSLPHEVFIYILKWVISQDLDVVSLEQLAKVCRGFYLCARDSEIWKLICLRTWGVNIDTPNRYGSWRSMFLQKPHVLFNGVYISKTTYIRYGEPSFQDTNYRPCYLVEYFRYLRFFPDGVVLMLTTPDDPYQSVYKLRSKKYRQPTVMSGRYKLVGNTVMAIVKKTKAEKAAPTPNYYHHRRQRQQNLPEVTEQTFHLELDLKNYKKKINCQLSWNRYSIHMVYRNGEEAVSQFDMAPANFPCFWYSRVKSFTSESESQLT